MKQTGNKMCDIIFQDELLDGTIHSLDMSLSKLWEMVKDRGALGCYGPWGSRVRHD